MRMTSLRRQDGMAVSGHFPVCPAGQLGSDKSSSKISPCQSRGVFLKSFLLFGWCGILQASPSGKGIFLLKGSVLP